MVKVSAHRGPDDQGIVLFRGGDVWRSSESVPPRENWDVGLGHRRLSILDLTSAGHQPMADREGRYWVVFNGEIYNYLELREELTAAGVEFSTRSDTEVLLASFKYWGNGCLTRFNGMWAFVVFDRLRRTVFCARDRMGIKPFYYSICKGRFVFSSELKQILEQMSGAPSLNKHILADFLFWGMETHTAETFYKGVLSLPPRHYLELTYENIASGDAEPVPYWELEPEEPLGATAAARSFYEILDDAVRVRLRSDVPVAVTLSGGLDSSSITCLAAQSARERASGGPLKAFTAVYPDAGYSEAHFAEEVVKLAGVEAIQVMPGAVDICKDWDRFVWTMEEPFGGLSYFSNWKVYEQIREHGVTVILNGQGGDELLLGYEQYRTVFLWLQLRNRGLKKVFAEIAGARKNAGMGYVKQLLFFLYFSLPKIRGLIRQRRVRPYLSPDLFELGRGRIGDLFENAQMQDRVHWQKRELFQVQLPHLLRHEDRVSMSFSVEARVPFLDYRLVNFVLAQDLGLLIRDGWSKGILREAMQGIVPETVLMRTDKMGFDTPTGRLLLENREFFVERIQRSAAGHLLNIPAILRDYESGSIDEHLLCSICSFVSWAETFGVAV